MNALLSVAFAIAACFSSFPQIILPAVLSIGYGLTTIKLYRK